MNNCYRWMVGLVLLVAFTLVGCAKKQDVDTAALQKSFASAETGLKDAAEKAMAAVQKGDYAGALVSLQQLATQAKLTPEQQQAVKDLLAQVQAKLGATVEKAAQEGKKALDDAKGALPKM